MALAWCSSFALNRSTPQVVIEQDSDGNFAYVPELKGCRTQGDRTEEAMK
ncbi:MAG: type II toxin-antitoxin system HicB family antitoxin [Flavobacteriales bacterium]|nr:type II toxin-antitoxin system HicB family antitoxin [Flavobacteriales bacterium]